MSGLLRRIRRARAASAPEPEQAAPRDGQTVDAHEAAQPGGDPPVPAGLDLDALVGARPTSRRRSALRRRLRHLRRVREVLLRDLGGMVFEVHRAGASADVARQPVVADKLRRLAAVTEELHALEAVLGDPRGMLLREPGIGGTCPACGEVFGSEARFCWACGTPVAPGAQRPLTPAAPLPALAAAPALPAAEPHIEGSGVDVTHEHVAEGGTVPAEGPTVAADAPTTASDAPEAPGEGPAEDPREPPADQAPTAILRPGDPLVERRR